MGYPTTHLIVQSQDTLARQADILTLASPASILQTPPPPLCVPVNPPPPPEGTSFQQPHHMNASCSQCTHICMTKHAGAVGCYCRVIVNLLSGESAWWRETLYGPYSVTLRTE